MNVQNRARPHLHASPFARVPICTLMILNGNYVTVENVGNITYGYLGKAADFTDFALYNASSLNDLINHKFTNIPGEQIDHYWIGVGINWYNSK